MSTIEKAAAKLAARGKKAAVNPANPPLDPPNEVPSGFSAAQQQSASNAFHDPAQVNPPVNPETNARANPPANLGAIPEPASQRLAIPDVGHQAPIGKGNYSAPRRWCEIDLEALTARGFISPKSGRGQLAQEMRRIKRPLLLNIQKANAHPDPDVPPVNLIMITSALPDEGKTFIAINLAMSLAAELDRRVLLIDADVSKSDITAQLDIEPVRGLSDLLAENNFFAEDAVLTSNIERLSILPAGEPNDHMDELFASDLMGEITRSLAAADSQRVVVFDAPPLLATTESSVLARHMGQVVVVVEANKTPQDAVSQALTQLEGCSNVSLVLNKTNRRESGGYGYGYGSGYGPDNDKGRNDEQRAARDAGERLERET